MRIKNLILITFTEFQVRVPEKSSVMEELEIDIFLDSILETIVWKEAEAFLRSKGK